MSKRRLNLVSLHSLVAVAFVASTAFGEAVPTSWPGMFAEATDYAVSQPGSMMSTVSYTSDEAVVQTGCCDDSCCSNGLCDDCCCDGCCGDDCCCGDACCDPKLLGLFVASDPCFAGFVSPITNPVFFEDPRTLTELRAIFMYNDIPGAVGGGSARLIAVQLRAALTDRLSVIATKDGFVMSSNPLVDDGWADVQLGVKYNLIADAREQKLLSVGLQYEMPVGSPRTLQARGDGMINMFVTGGMQLGDYWHWISTLGMNVALDDDNNSDWMYWSNHIDRQLREKLYVVAELNWFNWTRAGGNGINGVEGNDLINLGSTGVSGNDIVTAAIGAKVKPSDNVEIGFAWEFPLTDRRDLLENRLTADLILRY